MNRKLSLDIDALAVDSFETSARNAGYGTVRAYDVSQGCQPTPPDSQGCQPTPPEYAEVGCTCYASCLCPTNAYYCATVMATVISCDYTYNDSCVYDTVTCRGESCDLPCMDTETC